MVVVPVLIVRASIACTASTNTSLLLGNMRAVLAAAVYATAAVRRVVVYCSAACCTIQQGDEANKVFGES